MEFESFDHKGLKQLYQDDKTRGIPASMREKVKRLLTAIDCYLN